MLPLILLFGLIDFQNHRVMDTHSTTIVGFKVEKFVAFGTDSRSLHRAYGNLCTDDMIKIHHVCDRVLGAGAGTGRIIRKVFREVRKECRRIRPKKMKEVADIVATIALRNSIPSTTLDEHAVVDTEFMVAGWFTGSCEMFTITPSKIILDSKNSAKRKAEDAKEEYEYVVKEVDEVFLGYGKKVKVNYLNLNLNKNYPPTAATSLDEVKDLIKDAMRVGRRYDFCTDGKLRVVTIFVGGNVGYSSAEPIANQNGEYGDWIEEPFTPEGQILKQT